MAEEALVQSVRVYTCTSEPGADRGLTRALRPVRRRKDPAHEPGQRAPWRSAARGFSDDTRACSDGRVNVERQAGPRNVWMRSAWPCLPSPKSRMNLSIGNAEVQALLVGTGVPLGVDSRGVLPGGFWPRARGVLVLALALQPTREWRRDDRRSNRLGFVARADVGAWCAWLLLVRRKPEEETSQDARASPDRGGDRPQAGPRRQEGPYTTSLLEMGRRESSLPKQG